MGIKNVFKKIWAGVRVAEPYLKVAGSLAPPPFNVALLALDELINTAEARFPAEGSGVQKAQFYSAEGLKVLEIITGKNVSNPKTQAIVDRIGTVSTQIRNLTAQIHQFEQEYKDIVEELKDAIDSVKEPAKDDTAVAPV